MSKARSMLINKKVEELRRMFDLDSELCDHIFIALNDVCDVALREAEKEFVYLIRFCIDLNNPENVMDSRYMIPSGLIQNELRFALKRLREKVSA